MYMFNINKTIGLNIAYFNIKDNKIFYKSKAYK